MTATTTERPAGPENLFAWKLERVFRYEPLPAERAIRGLLLSLGFAEVAFVDTPGGGKA